MPETWTRRSVQCPLCSSHRYRSLGLVQPRRALKKFYKCCDCGFFAAEGVLYGRARSRPMLGS